MGNAKARLVDAGIWKTISQRALEASRPRYLHWSASANTDPETAAARHASEFWRQCTVSSFGTLSSQSHSLIQFSKSPSKSFTVALRFVVPFVPTFTTPSAIKIISFSTLIFFDVVDTLNHRSNPLNRSFLVLAIRQLNEQEWHRLAITAHNNGADPRAFQQKRLNVRGVELGQ